MYDGMQRELAFYPGTQLLFRDAKANNDTQIAQIQELVSKKIDLLIVSPNESEPLTPIVEQVYKSGIPVVVVDRSTSSAYFSAYVGADNYEVGRTAGQYAATLLKGKGRVIEITGSPKSSPASARTKGFQEALKPYEDIKIVSVNGAWTKETAKKALLSLEGLQDTDLVFAQNEVMALGAHEVLQALSANTKTRIIGVDGLPGALGDIQMVFDRQITATALYPTGGEDAIRVALSILRKQPYQKENILQTAIIDSSNVRMIKAQTDKIIEHQENIERQQKMIDSQLQIYQTQKGLLYVMTILFVVSIVLGSVVLYSLVENKKINKQLNAKNEEVLLQRNRIQDIAEKAQEATESKFRFFTNISHEFRTPLTLILGPVEDLLKGTSDKIQIRKNMLLVQKNAERLLWLVNQLMDFRKIESGKIRLQISENDMISFIREVMKPFEYVAKTRKIDFRLISNQPTIIAWFDTDMMDKVLFNLLSNAFKFTGDLGHIYIYVEKDGNQLIIKVEDNGAGLSEADITNAFEMFYQGNNAIKGTGLGLPLSREFVELHQGTIEANGKKGMGALFTIQLPLGKAHFQEEDFDQNLKPETVHMNTHLGSAIDGHDSIQVDENAPSVLLIEDNEDLLSFLSTLFHPSFHVHTASDGKSGLEASFNNVPDLVVCDVMLPEMDGLQVTSRLKSDLRTSHIPVILLTAKTNTSQQIEGMQTGADMYITKPFSNEFLLESARSLLSNRKILRSNAAGSRVSENSVSRIDRKFINDLRVAILSRLSDQGLTADELAKMMGLSRVQLFRKTKALLDQSVNDLIIQMRLERACLLLNEQNLTMAEIADETGFASQSYFSTVFKSKFGVSPRNWKGNS